jgi:ketosteroid isomerase-like protein
MKLRLALIAALALWPPAVAAETLPSDLARALDQYNRATVQNDVATLSTLMTDDYVLVNSDASVQDKTSYLADFRIPGFRIEPYAIEQPIYKIHGSAALTAWRTRLAWTQDGKQQSRRVRIAHWWFMQGGHWRISYTQLTRVPD